MPGVDTVNSMGVLENPETAVNKLAPYAFCNHFCDHKLDRDQFGIRFHGVALGGRGHRLLQNLPDHPGVVADRPDYL